MRTMTSKNKPISVFLPKDTPGYLGHKKKVTFGNLKQLQVQPGSPAKLLLLEAAKCHLAEKGVSKFNLRQVLSECEINQPSFETMFKNEHELIDVIFRGFYGKFDKQVTQIANAEYSKHERMAWYISEFNKFFSDDENLALAHELAVNGHLLYEANGFGVDHLFFYDRFRKSLSVLLAEFIENERAWELCRQYAKELKESAEKGKATLRNYVEWLNSEVLIIHNKSII